MVLVLVVVVLLRCGVRQDCQPQQLLVEGSIHQARLLPLRADRKVVLPDITREVSRLAKLDRIALFPGLRRHRGT